MTDYIKRFTDLLAALSEEAGGPGVPSTADHRAILIKACAGILNEKLVEGFSTPEEELDFFRVCTPLFISLSGFMARKTHKPYPHWISTDSKVPEIRPVLEWTGSKTDATELIYELIHTGVLNHGRATLSQTSNWFENMFKIDLGNLTKTFQEIRNRKKETTSFALRLDKALLRYIDQLDEEDELNNSNSRRA